MAWPPLDTEGLAGSTPAEYRVGKVGSIPSDSYTNRPGDSLPERSSGIAGYPPLASAMGQRGETLCEREPSAGRGTCVGVTGAYIPTNERAEHQWGLATQAQPRTLRGKR